MNRFGKALTLCFAGLIFSSCATDRSFYEAPVRDVGALSGKPRSEWHIDEVTYDELASMKPGKRPAIDTDEAGIWMVMDEAEKKLKTSGHLTHDEATTQYLKDITCKLAPEYCNDIRIYLVQIPHFNATMAPNGAIQIWTGLLLRVQNEAQLAAVIGHELGHYLRRHSLQRMNDAIDKTNALVFVQLAAAVAGIPIAGDVMALLTIASIQAFSRDHEREADGYGLALMSRAGYDPREFSKVWSWLMEEKKADKDDDTVPIFLSTHPASEERCEAMRELGERIVARGGSFEVGESRFLMHVLPRRAEYLQDELHLRNYDRTEKLLEMLIERGANPGELHFFRGELYRLRGNEGDIEKALGAYEKAVEAGSPPPHIHKAMGLIYIRLGRKNEAANAFEEYLNCSPECSDKKMILHMIKEIEQ